MLKNYFLIAWRSLVKNSTFYFVNIFGLSVGLACCLLISSYVYSELTYDTYPENAHEIYRVEVKVLGNGSWVEYPNVDYGVGSGIAQTYPEVAAFTRVSRGFQPYLRYKETLLKEQNMAVADSNFLEFFSIPLLAGDIKTALTEPNSIVITKAFAKKFFGDEDPMNKTLVMGSGELKITGLIDKVPDGSHFNFDVFLSGSSYKFRRESWSNIGDFTYLRLVPGSDANALEKKFPDLVMKHVVPEVQADMGVSLAEAQKAVNTFIFTLRPLGDIHLGSHTSMELGTNGDIKYVYIFGALAVFILLLACVNFINLSTATSSRRAREVGIRKVMGSVKTQLIYQFLTESVMLALCAMMLAYGIVAGVLPFFNQLTGKVTAFAFFVEPVTLLIVTGGVILVGIIAGLYPSFFLSSFNTIRVLKGSTLSAVGKKDFLRSGLVVFQFAVSTALLVATLVVYQQLNFMQNKKLGYDKDQVLVINDTRTLRANEQVYKDELLKDSRVINASVSRQMPGDPHMDGTQAFPKNREADESNAEIHINIYHVDYEYLSTLGIEMAYGRNLSRDFPSDSSAIVINETAAEEFGWTPESAPGKSIVMSGQREYFVVGVVKDFNYTSVRDKIAPLVMMLRYNSGSILVKLNPTDITGFLADAKNKWDAFNTEIPFTYSFLDEKFAALYFTEERTGKVFSTFAVIALLIAGLGLFGLSTFSAEQRTREIGIRKVLGASSQQVLLMLSKQFMMLVLIAFVIATPVIAWAMDHWLQDFAYRISITWWVFAVAAGISFLIAFLSMSLQAARAAVSNPVKSLKGE